MSNINQYLPNEFTSCSNLISREETDLIILIRYPTQDEYDKQDIKYPITKIVSHLKGSQSNRPYIATIIYRYFPSGTGAAEIQEISTLLLHQFTHILGFNKTIFTSKGLIRTLSTQNRMNTGSRSKLYFTGSAAINTAKDYFGCTDHLNYLDSYGIELDESIGQEVNDGRQEVNDGSIIHWSERILLGDYMTTRLYFTEQAISEITLSALVDLGWYRVNYYTGGLMKFGKNRGCEFFTDDCVEEGSAAITGVKTKYSNEFCSNIYEGISTFGTCSSGRQSMAFCSNLNTLINIGKGNSVYMRNGYKNSEISGFSESQLNEYCPYSSSDFKINNLHFNYNGNCKFGSSDYRKINKYIEEDFSETSFCVHSSLLNKKSDAYTSTSEELKEVKNTIRPTCYKMSCSEKSLTIHLGNELFVCPRTGGIIKINNNSYSNYTGVIFCPDYNLICTGTELCNNLFDCVEKNSTQKSLETYSVNANVSIEITTNDDTSLSNIITTDIYELSKNGDCPQYCQQCNIYRQCKICATGYKNYIGTKENDYEEIKCSNTSADGYYNYTKDGNTYFYKCIDNCKLCFRDTKDKCNQCYPTHYIKGDPRAIGDCTDSITGCIKYDNTSGVPNNYNGGADSYTECLQCNNTASYYCINNNRSTCVYISPNRLGLYGPIETGDNPCRMLCSERFVNCEACNLTSCTRCYDQSDEFNHYGNCLKKIDNCLRLDL